ncbi:hypothetical protein LXL04_016987 [Taraxacum kok-saghyz]
MRLPLLPMLPTEDEEDDMVVAEIRVRNLIYPRRINGLHQLSTKWARAFRVDSGLHPRSRLSAADGDLPQPIEQTYTLMSKIVDVQNEAGETQCRGWLVEIRNDLPPASAFFVAAVNRSAISAVCSLLATSVQTKGIKTTVFSILISITLLYADQAFDEMPVNEISLNSILLFGYDFCYLPRFYSFAFPG